MSMLHCDKCLCLQSCAGLDVLAGLAESALSEENGGWDLTDPPPHDMDPQADEGQASAPQPYSQPPPQGPAQTHPYNGASDDQPGQGQGRFPAQPPSHAQVHYPALGQLPLQPQHPGQVSLHGHQSHQPWGSQTQPVQRFGTAHSQGQVASPAQCNEAQLPGQLQPQRPAASVSISDGIIRPQAVRSQGFTMHRGHQLGPAGQLQTLPALPSASLGPTAPQSMALGPSAPQISSPRSQPTPPLGFQPVRPGPYNPKGSALGYLPAESAESNGVQAPEALSSDGAPGQAATSPTKNGPQPSVPGHMLQQYPLLGALPKVPAQPAVCQCMLLSAHDCCVRRNSQVKAVPGMRQLVLHINFFVWIHSCRHKGAKPKDEQCLARTYL